MTLFLDGGPPVRTNPVLEEFDTPFESYVRARAEDQYMNNFMQTGTFANELARDKAIQPGDVTVLQPQGEFGGVEEVPAPARLDAATAQARLKEADVKFTVPETGMSEQVLNDLIERKRRQKVLEDSINRHPVGAGSLVGVGAMLAAGILDPFNVAAGFVPVVGETRYAAMLAGASGGLGRAVVRAGVGAAEGGVGMTALEVPYAASRHALQDDYTMADSLVNIAFGSALGGGLHVAGGALGDLLSRIKAKEPGAALPPKTVDPLSEVVNPIDRTATREVKARQLGALTAENRPAVDAWLKGIDEEFGTQSHSSEKTPESILDKSQRPSILERKPWFDVEHIRDSIRFKSVVDNYGDLPSIVERMPEGWSVVKADLAKLLSPGDWGWRMTALDLRMPNKQIAEYYQPVPELQAAQKETGHALFEKWRTKDLSKLSEPELIAYQADRQASRKLYNDAWQAYLKRTGQTEGDIAASLDSVARASESRADASSFETPTKSSMVSSAENLSPEVQTPLTREAANPLSRTSTLDRSGVAETWGVSGSMADASISQAGRSAQEVVSAASDQVREAALRTGVAQSVQGNVPDVEVLFKPGVTVADIVETAKRQMAPEAMRVGDPVASSTAKERIEAAPKSMALKDAESELQKVMEGLKQRFADRGAPSSALQKQLAAVEQGTKEWDQLADAAQSSVACDMGKS